MTIVVDASVVSAALVDGQLDGRWAESVLSTNDLAAPHLMLVEVAGTLRRLERSGLISAGTAAQAHQDLLTLPVTLFRYAPTAPRTWELHHNLTTYDGWYVALAESLAAPLATLDRRLVAAPGPLCDFLTPDR